MITLEQAKKLQKKRSKACFLKFGVFVLLSAVIWCVLFFCTSYLTEYAALYILFPALLFVGAKSSRLFVLLQKKEFCGKIVNSNIKMTTARRYGASNQPGTTYAAGEIPVLEITVENDNGKRFYKETPYQWAWGEYKPGMQVCILRFIDQPVKIA